MSKQAFVSKHKVSNLEHGLTILETLREHPTGLGLTEIAAMLSLSKNLAFRITATLHERGYLLRDEENMRFTLSRKLLTMGYSAEAEAGLLEIALGPMRKLRDQVKETVLLCTISGNEGIVLESIPGLHMFRFVCETGMRISIHTSASAKAMLAWMPEEKAFELLEAAGMPRLTGSTLVTLDEFRREFEKIRKLGYAVDRQEGFEGIRCVGAPVFNEKGEPVAGVNLTGPSSRIPESAFEELGPIVHETVAEISKRLGYIGDYYAK